jgi:hypothetical protein
MDINSHSKWQQLEVNWGIVAGSIYMMGPFYGMNTFAAIQLAHHLQRQLADCLLNGPDCTPTVPAVTVREEEN